MDASRYIERAFTHRNALRFLMVAGDKHAAGKIRIVTDRKTGFSIEAARSGHNS
jgi:hypothetical protein